MREYGDNILSRTNNIDLHNLVNKNMKRKLIIPGIFIVLIIFGISSCKMRDIKTNEENKTSNSEDYYIHGAIGVGFKINVSQQEAEAVLKKYNLTFVKTNNLNLGMHFFYESGEKFAVKTGEGKEDFWISVLENESTVYGARWLPDPDKVLVD